MNKAKARKPNNGNILDKIEITITAIPTLINPNASIEAHIVCKNICIVIILLL